MPGYVHVLTHKTCKWDTVWKRGHDRCDWGHGLMLEQVRPMTSQFHRRKRETGTQEEQAACDKEGCDRVL